MRLGAAIWRAVKGRALALPFLFFAGVGIANAYEYQATVAQASFGGTTVYSGQASASAMCDAWITYRNSVAGGGPRSITKGAVQAFFSPSSSASGNLCSVTLSGTTYQVSYSSLTFRCDSGSSYQAVPTTNPPQCTACPIAGTVLGGVGFIATQDTVTTVPYNGTYCKVEGQGFCVGLPSGATPGQACSKGWTYTGVEGSAPATTQPTQGFTDGKVCSADGKRCVPIGSTDCGTVNGKYVCLSSSPAPGGCVSSTDRTICTANTSNPLVNPPAPGAAGVVTPPLAVLGVPSGTGSGGYVGGTSVNVWGPGGTGAAPTTGDIDPTQDTPNTEPCGGPTQPKCNVKIDETGIDAAARDTSFRASLNSAKTAADAEEVTAAAALATQAAVSSPAAGWAPSLPSINASSCQTINIEFFGGASKPFPPPYLCSALESYIKPLLAFFLYVITAGLILFSGIRSMTGNT